MRFAEVFLRLGSALVAWMVLYAYMVLLALLKTIGCGPDGDEFHSVLLSLAPFAVIAVLAVRVTRPLSEVHQILVRLSIPLALMLPFAARNTWMVFQRVNLEAASACSNASATGWHPYWAPVQFVCLLVLIVLLVGLWRSRTSD